MTSSFATRLPASTHRSEPSGLLAALRELRPGRDLAVAAAMGLAWLALVVWSGAGPDGWQAQVCADLAHRPASCDAVRFGQGVGQGIGKDQSRIVPVAETARAAS